MAKDNPTGDGGLVALTIPTEDREFLRGLFIEVREGIRDQALNPVALRREEAVYDALLAALDNGSVVLSGDLRCVLCNLAVTIDRESEYGRVVAEHAALLGLRRQAAGGQYEFPIGGRR